MEHKKFLAVTGLFVITFAVCCCIGRYSLSPGDIIKIIFLEETDSVNTGIFFNIRLPRIIFAAVNGAAMAVSGYVYQELFRNPLAAPDVLGVSGGACVGAVAAMLAGFSTIAIQAAGLIFGLFTVALTIGLSMLMGRRRIISLVLAGIIIKAAADATVMAFKYMADPLGELTYIDYKLMGSYHTVRWDDVQMLFFLTVIPLFVLYLLRWKLQILSLGDQEAKSMGLNAGRLRIILIVLATLPVAAGVSVTGVVSWVGLIVPHAIRFFAGGSLKNDFGISVFAGAAFMIWADTAARSLSTAEIPISIITSTVGAAFLLVILIKRRRNDLI